MMPEIVLFVFAGLLVFIGYAIIWIIIGLFMGAWNVLECIGRTINHVYELAKVQTGVTAQARLKSKQRLRSLGYENSVTYDDLNRKVMRNKREKAAALHEEVVQQFATAMTSCVASWGELCRVVAATGMVTDTDLIKPFGVMIQLAVLEILCGIVTALGDVPVTMGRLYQSVRAQTFPNQFRTAEECTREVIQANAAVTEARNMCGSPLNVSLLTLKVLAVFDTIQGSHHAPVVANAFSSLTDIAAKICPRSVAVDIVKQVYLQKFRPYMSDVDSRTTTTDCAECLKAFPVLHLSPDADEDAVEQSFKDLAQIFHPDRFAHMSERVRNMAEEQQKEVCAAYNHIMSHFKAKAPYQAGL